MVECCLGGVETSPLVGGICNTPTYCDLRKAAKDDFNKGYGFGSVKVRLRTKSCRGVEFSTSGHAYTDTEKAAGNLETKYKVCSYGLAFTQKWNIDDTLGTEIASQSKLAEGSKHTLDTVFAPNPGKKSGKLKASYKWDCFSLGSNVDADFSGPTIFGFGGWLAGSQTSFDTARSKLPQNGVALGYTAADFQLHMHVSDGPEFGESVYQEVNGKIGTSINVAWMAGSNNIQAVELLYLLQEIRRARPDWVILRPLDQESN
ncbi:voltage-dependent anion-selective channel protein 3-like [Acinonyx jubatus]|uniref:Non-selective voltage-gated ion channel VDAC3 n=1 Tax=Acinonyx jubatus TaxID=32536 RepID=A0ABM3Q2C9_ACIJB|nr:voltage-dependent anion-selective channel protein 3-like [Acinonyx jubatus]